MTASRKPSIPRTGKGKRAPQAPAPRRTRTLKLEGRLTVERARALRGLMAKAVSSATPLQLSFGEVSEVDLSFLQLLIALGRAARSRGTEVSVGATGFPPAIGTALREAGLEAEAGSLGWGGRL